jgi:hypothetical protein
LDELVEWTKMKKWLPFFHEQKHSQERSIVNAALTGGSEGAIMELRIIDERKNRHRGILKTQEQLWTTDVSD